MAKTTRPKSSYDLKALLDELGIDVKNTTTIHNGEVYEIEIPGCTVGRGLVFDNDGKALTVGARVDLPDGSPLRAASPVSDQALALLGALNFSLEAQELSAKSATGKDGVEGVMISARICRDAVDPSSLQEKIETITQVVDSINPHLGKGGRELIDAVLGATRIQVAKPTDKGFEGRDIIAPTFDEEARDRLMKRLE